MARPRKTGLDYFPHDVDVTTDPKIEPVILLYGAAGYAFYFVHLEYCYRSDDFSIDVSDTETGQEMRLVIQKKLQIDSELYDKILRAFLRHKAFDEDTYRNTGKLTSAGIWKRAAKVLEKRKREAERYKGSTPPLASDISAAETTAEMTQSKEKKSIAKKSIAQENIASEDAAEPTLQERRFQEFWTAYPKKVGKKSAQQAWKKAKVNEDLFTCIMTAIDKAMRSTQWQRDGGRYIPNPSTWLNQGRWDDEIQPENENKGTMSPEAFTEQKSRVSLRGFKMAQDE